MRFSYTTVSLIRAAVLVHQVHGQNERLLARGKKGGMSLGGMEMPMMCPEEPVDVPPTPLPVCTEGDSVTILTDADCGNTFDTGGLYLFASNITCDESGFTFTAPDTVVDCQSYTLAKAGDPSASALTFLSSASNAIIRQCDIAGFGVGLLIFRARSPLISDVTVSGAETGVNLLFTLGGTIVNAQLNDNLSRVTSTRGAGILATGSIATVVDSTVNNNQNGILAVNARLKLINVEANGNLGPGLLVVGTVVSVVDSTLPEETSPPYPMGAYLETFPKTWRIHAVKVMLLVGASVQARALKRLFVAVALRVLTTPL